MQKSPLVTVICLCYNHAAFVIESLDSVLNQNYDSIELIIVDDCSDDSSNEKIESWLKLHPNTRFISNRRNLGNTKSFNIALEFAKGEYVIDLAADDILLPNCVLQQLEKFKSSSFLNLGVVYGNVENIKEDGSFDSYYFPVDGNKTIISKRVVGSIYESVLNGGDSICSVSSMIKKTVLDDLNGYDDTLAYEDLDLWIRASRKYDFDFVDEVLVKKRIVKNSHTHNFSKYKNEINNSTFKILQKAKNLNQKKSEDRALLKRVNYGMKHNYKLKNWGLLMKYAILKMLLHWRIIFN